MGGKKKESQVDIYKVPLYLQYLRIQLLVCLVNFGLTNSKTVSWDFPGGLVVNNLPAPGGDMGSGPGQGRSHMLWDS